MPGTSNGAVVSRRGWSRPGVSPHMAPQRSSAHGDPAHGELGRQSPVIRLSENVFRLEFLTIVILMVIVWEGICLSSGAWNRMSPGAPWALGPRARGGA